MKTVAVSGGDSRGATYKQPMLRTISPRKAVESSQTEALLTPKEYFFHFSAAISPHLPEDVHEGASVVFNAEKDLTGDRAASVELIDLMHQAEGRD